MTAPVRLSFRRDIEGVWHPIVYGGAFCFGGDVLCLLRVVHDEEIPAEPGESPMRSSPCESPARGRYLVLVDARDMHFGKKRRYHDDFTIDRKSLASLSAMSAP